MKRVVVLILIFLILVLTRVLYQYNIIPHLKYSNEDFKIIQYVSVHDKDMDGVDDQTDILQNVRAYIATRPKYQSKYYATGYPNDEYGVCTDVVAQGLLHAGYDIMELLHQDVLENPGVYNILDVDKNIDFRRVENLDVYFRRNAISLTTDIRDISAWQGGDIVVFQKHIGIVSDTRNYKGISFVLHHGYPGQPSYEEDILERDEKSIIGHYRIS